MFSYKGLSLIELSVVLILISILVAVGLPRFFDLQREAKIVMLKDLKVELMTAFESFSYKVKTSKHVYYLGDQKYLNIGEQPIRVNQLDDFPIFSFKNEEVKKEINALMIIDDKYKFRSVGDALYIYPQNSSPWGECKLIYDSKTDHPSPFAPKKSDIQMLTKSC